jgi:hypothetical protein
MFITTNILVSVANVQKAEGQIALRVEVQLPHEDDLFLFSRSCARRRRDMVLVWR